MAVSRVLFVWALLTPGWAGAAPLWEEGGGASSGPSSGTLPDFSRLAERSIEAVVSISTLEDPDPGDDPIKNLLEPKSEPQKGLGSGFFINPDGYLVTNAHVVEETSGLTVTVRRRGHRREYQARVVGTDQATDVALLKIDPEEGERFVTLPLGDSDGLKVAEWVAAIGNPYGLSHSFTVGVVSYMGRTDVAPAGREGYYDYIQTDASINPGNSGGPLINLRGEVVGVANAVNAVGQGIGFAVPIRMVKQVLMPLLTEGRVRRSWIGITVRDLTPELAREHGLPAALAGVLVSEVVEGGPGAAAGLAVGDVLTAFDGTPVDDAQRLRWLAAVSGAGRDIGLALTRGEKTIKTRVTLGAMPEVEPIRLAPQPLELGFLVEEVDVPRARAAGLALPRGAAVREVRPDSPAEAAGLRKGDVILKAGDRVIRGPKALTRALSRLSSGESSHLVLRRNGQTVFLSLRKP